MQELAAYLIGRYARWVSVFAIGIIVDMSRLTGNAVII